ncbi:hypothetical protein Q8F55_009212 [Vanrija albida]|uniref:Uncharacterized protein n=1 Tax=Vanrija albida TaxID=181172 RepID=A0ABR3PU04_9TREE
MRLAQCLPLLAAFGLAVTATARPHKSCKPRPASTSAAGNSTAVEPVDNAPTRLWVKDGNGTYTPPAAWERDDIGFVYIPFKAGEPPTNISVSDNENAAQNLGVAAAVPLVAGLIAAILKAVLHAGKADRYSRGKWVEDIVTKHMERAPDKNIFVFHRHQGFEWWVENRAEEFEEATIEWGREDVAGMTEYYGIVSFKGPGQLNRNNADGGWENWGYWGPIPPSRDGSHNTVTFY